jgi:2-oxo-4-hydroxy-4-carboxy-5-ureidoimidazoline decarboxylase
MTLSLARLNTMPADEAAQHFRACCGSSRWVEGMIGRRPFESVEQLLSASDAVWQTTGPRDWNEAFAHHPRIGERQAATHVSATARAWSAGEQGAAHGASTRAALAQANKAYEERFGRIYLVCAAGRSGEELLADIAVRMNNPPGKELEIAVEEQRKIITLRLTSLIGMQAS